MESRIKVIATYDQMLFFERHFCVKMWEMVKQMNEKEGRWLYDVCLRHGEEHGRLRGTFKVETLMEMLRQEAAHDSILIYTLKHTLDSLQKETAFFDEKIEDVLNDALSEQGLKIVTK